jgi:hypothetical protein
VPPALDDPGAPLLEEPQPNTNSTTTTAVRHSVEFMVLSFAMKVPARSITGCYCFVANSIRKTKQLEYSRLPVLK